MARLVIFDKTVRAVDLPSHPVILGRSQKADVPIHDSILSRKHCSIVPAGSGHRLIDLKSSNGTYLNGRRIEGHDLRFEDVIEIGNTVIVLLDTDTWKRGDGLTGLKNPLKARKLVAALEKRSVELDPAAAPRAARRLKKGKVWSRKKRLRGAEAEFVRWVRSGLLDLPIARDLLEAYAFHHAASLVLRSSKSLRRVLAAVMERSLTEEVFRGGLDNLRAAIRRAVDEAVESVKAERAKADADPGPGEEGRAQ